ncbi:hypothetical protein BDF22DRAFT_741190 [Syncephalis plumigaleata]|nr:hypothetical protein BDF22DRAFT_741190 [Syncephalis plumigaleata]
MLAPMNVNEDVVDVVESHTSSWTSPSLCLDSMVNKTITDIGAHQVDGMSHELCMEPTRKKYCSMTSMHDEHGRYAYHKHRISSNMNDKQPTAVSSTIVDVDDNLPTPKSESIIPSYSMEYSIEQGSHVSMSTSTSLLTVSSESSVTRNNRSPASRFSMGPRQDCAQCRAHIPGHYAHIS